MKTRSLAVGGLVVAATLVAPIHIDHQVDTLSKKERFALELTQCQEAHAAGKPDKCKLFGKIQVVDSFPDVKIKEVKSFPDIKVKWVKSFPDKPGKWKKVKSFPDYKVKFVDSFPGCD